MKYGSKNEAKKWESIIFFGIVFLLTTTVLTTRSNALDRSILPPPDSKFQGEIEISMEKSTPDFPKHLKAPKNAPNILLIMGDDIGYGHMSAFGGPANTPIFDNIAKQGVMFTNFHTTPVCAASRAALLTGRNAHSVGMGAVPEIGAGFPGHNNTIPKSTATILEILRQNGYGTAFIGKNHITPLHELSPAGPFDRWPTGLGAEYFYGFIGAGVSQWHPPLWENTTPTKASRTPEEGYILETELAEKTIEWIKRQKTIFPDKPWFVHYAPSTHKPPIAAPEYFIQKYRGKFDSGYDKLREEILARQIELGVVPKNTKLSPWPDFLPRWDELTALDKKVGARWMEVFSGAVEYTDHEIGRIISAIEDTGEIDNTLVIYIAGDNGPSPEGGLHGIMNKLTWANEVKETLEDLAKHIDDFGGPKSHGSYPAAWGYATSTPFNYGKTVTAGGGVSTAMAVSWPNKINANGGKRHQFHHLIDVVPTILEAAAIPAPQRVNGIKQKPMEGKSMLYAFNDEWAKERRKTQYFELTGGRAIYHEGWWAGTRHGLNGVDLVPDKKIPFDEDVWELFDMREDFGQANNLASKYPNKLKELQDIFNREALKYNVYPMAHNLIELVQQKRPTLVSGNKASYGPGIVRLPEDAVIDVKNRSFSITAKIENSDGKAEGMIVTLGGETGGYGLMVLGGKPTFIYNYLDLEVYKIISSEKLPAGKSSIKIDFKYDGGGVGKGGLASMSLNGSIVGKTRIEKTVPYIFAWDDTFDVGEDWGTPVSRDYKPPFKFTGKIEKVTINALSGGDSSAH